MPERFSAAGALTAPRHATAANDNPPVATAPDFASRVLLREALRQFAAHGAAAPEHARRHAEQAFFAGNRRDYLHWSAICHALDRRLVAIVTAQLTIR